jgi:hypothetical protein
MKIYFAGYTSLPKINQFTDSVLVSYLDFSNPLKFREFFKKNPVKDVFLDSGAFTAFTKGKKIDINEYIKFVQEVKDLITVYANLDVIGDSEATYKNWVYMRSKGLDPLAVIHYGADEKWFDIYLRKHKVKYLALGGLVPYTKRRNKLKIWLDSCYSGLKNYWPVRIHLFGVISQWVLERYPIFSCDSTSWLYASRSSYIVD